MLDTTTRKNITLTTLCDPVIHSECLPKLNKQIKFFDITDHCAMCASCSFSLEKSCEKPKRN